MKTSEELKEEYNNGPKLRYFIGGVFGFFALFLIILGGNFSLLSFGDFFLLFIISAPIGYGIWALNDKFRYKEFQIQYAKALKRERKKETKKQRAKRLAQEKADQKEREREANYRSEYNKTMFQGVINEKLVCPHCQSKGTVRTIRKRQKEETRQKGIIGATIGMKTVTDKGMITRLSCDSCDMKWTS